MSFEDDKKEYDELHARAHSSAARGGWGVRIYESNEPSWIPKHPSGSYLNSYSTNPLGDVVCWDEKKDAERAAELMKLVYLHLEGRKTEVEEVKAGQVQPSIADERKAIEIANAATRAWNDAIAAALKVIDDAYNHRPAIVGSACLLPVHERIAKLRKR